MIYAEQKAKSTSSVLLCMIDTRIINLREHTEQALAFLRKHLVRGG